jgi:hypothetical protein
MKEPWQVDWHPIARWLQVYPRGPTTENVDNELDTRPIGKRVVPLFMRAKVKELE